MQTMVPQENPEDDGGHKPQKREGRVWQKIGPRDRGGKVRRWDDINLGVLKSSQKVDRGGENHK